MNSGCQIEFHWEILNGPRLVDLGVYLVGDIDGEAQD